MLNRIKNSRKRPLAINATDTELIDLINKFLISLRIQLEHLGMIVYPRTINISKSKPLDFHNVEKILKHKPRLGNKMILQHIPIKIS